MRDRDTLTPYQKHSLTKEKRRTRQRKEGSTLVRRPEKQHTRPTHRDTHTRSHTQSLTITLTETLSLTKGKRRTRQRKEGSALVGRKTGETTHKTQTQRKTPQP
ncbi:hypothetical protein E2C01_088315 [Portunus trituberculatus]|uniref:Uncharacterized protein n=1 Tax=Portunus trituberculatus TaxID=210409 RepID=A0A5B7JFM9_PORTR|nr:hypothetical protein [Portunus trituberculatus]